MMYRVHFWDDVEVDFDENHILNYIKTVDKETIYSVDKLYSFKNTSGLCLYCADVSKDTDYIGNYLSLPKMYGPNPISKLDIEIVNYFKVI